MGTLHWTMEGARALCLILSVAKVLASAGGEPDQGGVQRGLDNLGNGNILRKLDTLGYGNILRQLDTLDQGNILRQLDTLGEENILRGLVDSQQKRGFDAM